MQPRALRHCDPTLGRRVFPSSIEVALRGPARKPLAKFSARATAPERAFVFLTRSIASLELPFRASLRGFSGTLPQFRRAIDDRTRCCARPVDFLICFDSSGVVVSSRCPSPYRLPLVVGIVVRRSPSRIDSRRQISRRSSINARHLRCSRSERTQSPGRCCSGRTPQLARDSLRAPVRACAAFPYRSRPVFFCRSGTLPFQISPLIAAPCGSRLGFNWHLADFRSLDGSWPE
jgi:hypothetical protein